MKPTVSIAALVLIQGSIALPRGDYFQVSGGDSNDINGGDDGLPPGLLEGILGGIEPHQGGPGVQGSEGQSDDDSAIGGNQGQDGTFGNNWPSFPQGDDSNRPQNGPGGNWQGSFPNGPDSGMQPGMQPGPGGNWQSGPGFPQGGPGNNGKPGYPQTGPGDSSNETDDDNEVDSGQNGPGAGPGAGAGKQGDDYPFKNCDQIDKYGVTTCQCTSFAAWRVDQRLHVPFKQLGDRSGGWGNANKWDRVAEQAGITVDNNPAPGSVAQNRQGQYGHVAWVVAVNGDTVSIEDYNGSGGEKRYGRAQEPRSKYQYIHFETFKGASG